MEIRVEERLTGRQLRSRILASYMTRARLEAAARRRGGAEARDALFNLRLLEEDPRRLDLATHVVTVHKLSGRDVERLTHARLRMWHQIAQSKEPLNLTALAQRLGRDKKNVSDDLRVLQNLGLVGLERKGRETHPVFKGNEIHILVAPPAA